MDLGQTEELAGLVHVYAEDFGDGEDPLGRGVPPPVQDAAEIIVADATVETYGKLVAEPYLSPAVVGEVAFEGYWFRYSYFVFA